MVRITFKGVGQGDSIIIEWKNELGKCCIGIVDCNLYNNSNPVLEQIKDSNYESIEFIVLSHPHSDHFSGLRNLIEYCISNKIKIGTFFHSCHQVPDYLKAACKSITSSKELILLFSEVKELYKRGEIEKDILTKSSLPFIYLTNDIKIKCLSPSERERDDYISSNSYPFNEEDDGNIPKANLLSSILKIYSESEGWYILLTADAEAKSFVRLYKKMGCELKGDLLLAQYPHHGSRSNFKRQFWRIVKNEEEPFVAYSVGKNQYGHPSRWGRDILINFGYKLRYTSNIISLGTSEQAKSVSSALDVFSKPIYRVRDLIFEVNDGIIKEL